MKKENIKPIYKKIWFWIVLIIIVLILLFVLLSLYLDNIGYIYDANRIISQRDSFEYVEPLDQLCNFNSQEECNSHIDCNVKYLDDYIREDRPIHFTCCPKNKKGINYSFGNGPCSWILG